MPVIDRLTDLIMMLESILAGEDPDGELYTEVDVDGADEKKESIPERKSVSRPEAEAPSAEKSGGSRPVRYVSYSASCPDYDGMDRGQRSYYRYWRTEAMEGRAVQTDLSYIYVYVSELLSGLHWKAPEEGYQMLQDIWQLYRNAFPEMDADMASWTFEFAMSNSLEFVPPADVPYSCYPGTAWNVMIDQHRSEMPLKLPFPLILCLCDYDIVQSKFYQAGHQDLLEEAIPRVVALADAALCRQKGAGLLKLYGPPKSSRQVLFLYRGTSSTNRGQRFTIRVHPYTMRGELRSEITRLVRFTENELRSLYGYRGKLRDTEVDEDLAPVLSLFLSRAYSPEKAAPKEKEKAARKVALDFGKIGTLREESDRVRDALAVPDEAGWEEAAHETKEDAASRAAKGERTDEGHPAHEAPAAGARPETGSAGEESADAAGGRAPDAGPEDAALTEAGGAHPGARAFFHAQALPDALRDCVEALDASGEETLFALLTEPDPAASLARIAEEAMTLPELLLDAVNEAAAETLGDILIDTAGEEPAVLEEYAGALLAAVKRA